MSTGVNRLVTPLLAVSAMGRCDEIRALIAQGADLSATTVDGNIALWLSAANGNLEAIQILIDAGVDLVNFDAFDYGETIALYPEAVKRHIEAGNALAWGIVYPVK